MTYAHSRRLANRVFGRRNGSVFNAGIALGSLRGDFVTASHNDGDSKVGYKWTVVNNSHEAAREVVGFTDLWS